MELKTRAIKSTAWYAANRVWTQAVSWGVTLVLARLLVPADYGLFAMALAVNGFIELFQEFGLGVAIIQRQALSRSQLNAIFWLASAGSLAAVVVAFLAAGFVARFFGEPRLGWILPALSLTLLLNSVGLVPYSLLTKEIDFRRRSLAEGCGVVVSAGVSLALAFMGHGVWALVGGHLAGAAIKSVAMSILCGWRPGLPDSFDGIGSILKFSLPVAGATVIGDLSSIANTTLIGRLLGGHALGLYTMAHTLGNNPLRKLSTSIVNQLSLPVFSKLQADEPQLRRYFLKVTKYLAVISLPMQVGMALVAHDLVIVVLSAKWAPMVGLLQAFSIGGIFYALPLPSAPLLTARGRTALVFRVSWMSAGGTAVALAIGAQFGLAGIAAAWLISFGAVRLYLLWLALRDVQLTVQGYLANLLSCVYATAAMAGIVVIARAAIPAHLPTVTRLALTVVAGAASYSAILLASDRGFGTEVKSIVGELRAPSRA